MKSLIMLTAKNPEIPFFSVCVETHNREKTILDVLQCIEEQNFLDFELIIVDNGSTDQTVLLIKKFLKTTKLKKTIFIIENKKSTDIEGWNAPVLRSSGRFIAICEGDDYYAPDHLEKAYEFLNASTRIGIYEVSTGGGVSPNIGITICTAKTMLAKLRRLEWCPVPSAVIFKRCDEESGLPYLYDPTNVYAGEYFLYNRILMDEYQVAINSSKQFVTRGTSFYLKNDFHLRDARKFLESSKSQMNMEDIRAANLVLTRTALTYFLMNMAYLKYEHKLMRIICSLEIEKRLKIKIGLRTFLSVFWEEFKKVVYFLVKGKN